MTTVQPHAAFQLFPASGINATLQLSRMPETSFVIQKFNVPDVAAQVTLQKMGGVNIKHIPDKLEYENLNVSFLVDETFRAYRELYDWLVGMTGGSDRTRHTQEFMDKQSEYIWPDYQKRKTFALSTQSDATLTVVTGLKRPILKFVYFNVMPIHLGRVNYDITSTDPNKPVTATASFSYDFFEILDIK